ncbi:DUF5908 family protein [uncultured Dokdonia sp.]|uniref:DUF5908 family protein n=1 Tax=uncultured Dokdonia sp. TaxID=575653 RepID=UPI00260286CD|nr:DUF5908 family protein [uncultured Dokdonia sp.]
MPIEIKELHIKINVDEDTTGSTGVTTVDQKRVTHLIQENVAQIMKIHHRKKER